MTEMLSGGDALIRALKDEGVELVFGYPGGAALHIYDAIFRQKDIEHILVRHEQAATHAADGYARASGKVGTVIVTSGPGATNAVTGIATAYMDSIPMVVISGQVPSSKIGEDAFQETDMVGVSRPVVKHSFLVKRAEDIPMIIKKAYYIARSGRPGPVVVDIPKDITSPHEKFAYSYPESVDIRSYQPVKKGHAGQIRKAMKELLAAKRPVIYIGGGAVLSNAFEGVRQLVDELGYPVTNTLMGLGAYPGSAEKNLGMLGMHGTYESNMAMHHADLILVLGARLDDRTTNDTKKYCPDATIIHVDIDPTTISKTVQIDIPIVGPLDEVVSDMLEYLDQNDKRPDADALKIWWDQCNQWRQQHGLFSKPNHDASKGELIKPQDVIKTLYKVTGGEAVVTSDVGQHQMFAAQYYHFDWPRQWINSGGLGTMGFGLPAAMGAIFSDRDTPVACVTGEGSIQMCIQELSTCNQYHLPVKIINLNNQALGMVKQWQDMNYEGRHSQSLYEESLPDFIKLAEAYGHVGIKVTRFEELEEKMQEAFAMKDRLVFMDIYVDPTEHVYPMLVPEGSMRDMWVSKTERT
jgi:acetolactate synthase-1/2/3 large subunit